MIFSENTSHPLTTGNGQQPSFRPDEDKSVSDNGWMDFQKTSLIKDQAENS